MSVNTRMRVGRHTNVTFINASVHDTNFTNASTALGVDSGANDVPCGLTLQRLDSYNFSGGGSSDVVDTQAEYEDTRDNAANSYTTIVNTLNWCVAIGSWGGCGFPTGGARPYLVTRALAVSAQAGIVYAHEFGHTTGLNHDNTGQQIMDPDVLTTTDNRVLNVNVCDFFFRRAYASTCPTGTFAQGQYAICSPTLGPPSFAPPIFSSAPSGMLVSSDGESDFSDVPIEELARNIIVDRIPHEAEFFYSQEDVEILSAMLDEAADAPFNRTIVTLIGLISDGSPEDIFAIQDHLGNESAELSAGMIALGYLVNRTGSDIALDILLESLNGKTALSGAAALGLAVSGDPTALAVLEKRASFEQEPAILAELKSAIQENLKMAELGLQDYYRQQEPPPTEGRVRPKGEAQEE
jgi:hypothetical protein